MEARGLELPENLKNLAETSQGATAQEASTLLEKYGPSEETPVTTRMVKSPAGAANPNSAASTIR
ncbi:lipoyl synthase, partial [Corynebacterium amycolatum]